MLPLSPAGCFHKHAASLGGYSSAHIMCEETYKLAKLRVMDPDRPALAVRGIDAVMALVNGLFHII